MKPYLIFSFFLFFSLNYCTNKKQIENDLNLQKLHGKVHKIEEYSYDAYSKDGQIIKGDKIESLIQYVTYNKDGNLLLVYMIDKKHIFEYNDKGKKIKDFLYIPHKKLDSFSNYIYNEHGYEIKNFYFNADSSLIQLIESLYDSKGNKIQQIFYDKNMKHEYTIKMKYNDFGYLIEDYFLTLKGQKYLGYFYTYDARGNKTGKFSSNFSPKPISSQTYKYDEFGNIIEEKFELVSQLDTLIDNKNSIQIYKKLDRSDHITYSYEFDSNKNWIKRIKSKDGKISEYTERRIEYYK